MASFFLNPLKDSSIQAFKRVGVWIIATGNNNKNPIPEGPVLS
jgi:hypothetical protein